MINHDQRWSLPRGNTPVPSRWQATPRGCHAPDDGGRSALDRQCDTGGVLQDLQGEGTRS
jgi:hypothetical protein